jgi:hypothetical protein
MKYSKIEVYCQPLKFLFPISNVMTLESLQLQNNVNNLYIVLIFFLNIPIPCYIFIKQMSLFYSFCKYKNVYISRFCSLPRRRRKSRLLYSSVYNRCDGNGKFSYMRDRGVKETMSQWIFISLIATNERVVYSRF